MLEFNSHYSGHRKHLIETNKGNKTRDKFCTFPLWSPQTTPNIIIKRSLQVNREACTSYSSLNKWEGKERKRQNISDPFLWWILTIQAQALLPRLASSESEWPATGSGRPELDWGQQLQPQNVIKVCLDLFNFQPLIKRVWNEDWESSRAKSSTQLLEIQSAGFFTSKETESYWLLSGSPG